MSRGGPGLFYRAKNTPKGLPLGERHPRGCMSSRASVEVWPSSQRITAMVVAGVQRVAIRSTKPTITPIPMGHMAPQLPTTGWPTMTTLG